jgi:NitT/TauT family transport system permease protein
VSLSVEPTAPASLPALDPAYPGGRRRGAGTARTLAYYLPAVGVFLGGIVAWEVLVGALNLQAFVFPKPSAILAALQANWSGGRFALLPSAIATLQEAVLGLAIGTVAGLVVAFASARWVTARGILLPLAVAANAVPIIAFAPLLNNWFGLINPVSKALMAAVLVFFPVMANVTRGLVQVEPASLELMRSYAASEWTILRKVRIPNALPFFFTAMKIATTLSLIGAIVGEYFGGSATVITFYLVVVAVERLVIPWHAAMRVET